MKINILHDKEFKIIIMEMLAKVRGTMHEISENFNTEKSKIPNRNHISEKYSNGTEKLQ